MLRLSSQRLGEAMLSAKNKAAVRSAVTTALSIVALLVAVSQVGGVSVPGNVVAVVVTGGAVLRTVLAWLDGGMPLYGRGSE